MKKLIFAVSIAAVLSAGSFAIAQDAGVNVNAGADAGVKAETPAGGADAGVNAGAAAGAATSTAGAADNTSASVMALISGSSSADLSGVTQDNQITIVLLSSLEGGTDADKAALDEALKADAEGQTTLHTNVEGNAAIKAKLKAEGHSTSDVVAVKLNADGSVIVYVDDRS